MELGNMMFGNSRGSFAVDRDGGFSFHLRRLFHAAKLDEGYATFENDTFSVFPYYWGDCTCGFEEQDFSGVNHVGCYQNEVDEELRLAGWTDDKYGWLERPKGMDYKQADKIEDVIRQRLCFKHGLTFPLGCAVHCTCDYKERMQKLLNEIGYPDGHKPECLLERPNFFFKPTGYSLKWYKYPLRDAYANEDLSEETFAKMIDDCIKSVAVVA